MPRQVRIEYEGALYHVMARGNRRNRIFASPDGADEELFLKTLGEATVWKTLAENTGLEARGGTFREVAEAGLSGVRITLPADCGESKAMMGWFIV